MNFIKTNSNDSLRIILAIEKLKYGSSDLEHLKMLLQDWVSNFYSDSLGDTKFSINGKYLEVATSNKIMFNELKQFTEYCDFLKVIYEY